MLAVRRTHALLRCARHLSAAPRPNPDATAAFRRLMRARAALFRDDAYACCAAAPVDNPNELCTTSWGDIQKYDALVVKKAR